MKIEESIEIVQKEAEEIKNGKGLYYLYYDETLDDRKRTAEAIENLLTAYEKEKEKNKELTERVLKLESDKFWDNVVGKSKIKQIIYPTPENPISLEVQQSEIYKKLLKEVEE